MNQNKLPLLHEEIRFLTEALNEQIESALAKGEVLPLIERDIIKETLRKLYIQVGRLSDIPPADFNNIPGQQLLAADKATPEPPVQTAPEINENIEITAESKPAVNELNDAGEAVSIPTPLTSRIMAKAEGPLAKAEEKENPVIKIQREISIEAVEVQVKEIKTDIPAEDHETAIVTEEKNFTATEVPAPATAAKKQAYSAATLFDEQPTVAGKYKPAETVVEKLAKASGNRSLAESLKAKPLADLKSSIGINERFAFINELFSGDQQLYHNSIDAINRMQQYEEARRLIFGELSEKLGWTENAVRLKEFDDLVRRRFNA